ncbi:MAG: metallophosphoesterase [Erysipelotrichaceae bacterium]|nr:metallophosphoesterase [Erysipelotrichaceae bacterium]
MRKKIIIISVLFLILISLIGYIAFNSTHGALTSFTISYRSLESNKLPKSFNDTSVMFLSDIEYGTYFGEERLKKLENRLKNVSCDIIIFGGDLFDRNYAINPEDIGTVTAFLKGLSASLGKFAILGDFDINDPQKEAVIRQILYDGDFELLDQQTFHLHNKSEAFITLTGISYTSSESIADYFLPVSESTLNLAVIHGAKLYDSFPNNLIDLTLCGHSHHVQVDYPFFGAYQQYNMTGSYKAGSYNSGQSLLYVSRGIGTTNVDRRLFSSPEIVIFRLKSK